MNQKNTSQTKHSPAVLANVILLSAGALSTWGAVELAGGDSPSSRVIVGGFVAGVELGLLALVGLAARERQNVMRGVYLIAALACLALSLVDQYAFLLSRANGMEERANQAVVNSTAAAADEAAVRAELSSWTAALARELQTTEGPKARSARERVDSLRTQLASIQRTASEAATIHQHRPALLVACDRFGISPDTAIKVMLAAILLVGNGTGFLLLYASKRRVDPQTGGPSSDYRLGKPHCVPNWLAASRRRIQEKCTPSALDVALGKRTPV